MAHIAIGQNPLSAYVRKDNSLTVPNVVFEVAGETPNDPTQGAWRTYVTASVTAPPGGATHLRVYANTPDGNLIWTVDIGASEGVWRVGNLPDGMTGEVRLRAVYLNASGKMGKFSPYVLDDIPDPVTPPDTDPAYTSPPFLILTSGGARVGETLNVNPGAFPATFGPAVTSLYRTDADDDDPAVDGTEITPFIFGTTLLGAGAADKFLWARSENTAGEVAWSEVPLGPIIPAPLVEIDLDAADVEIVDVVPLNDGSGLHHIVVYIDPATGVLASDFDGIEVNTGRKVWFCFTRLNVTTENALLHSLTHLIPGDAPGHSMLLTELNEDWTGANGFWRVCETAAQTAANAGTQWVNSEYLKEDRPADMPTTADAQRRRMRLWHTSSDGGVHKSGLSTWYKSPEIDDDTIPTDPATAYWRSIERTPEMLAQSPTTYGFGYQFLRSLKFCEDEPNYGIGGGDMNGIRLTKTMGGSWYHAEGVGMKAFAFNSVDIDPVDPNYLLAMGSWAWMNRRTNPSYANRTGIWRSTDFGKTWAMAFPVDTTSQEAWNQQLFCFDPASRSANSAAQRVWYCLHRVRKIDQQPTAIRLFRSNAGGAPGSWSQVGADIVPTTMGELYQLKAHPTSDRLYAVAQTGLWISNTAKTAWTRITVAGAANVKATSIDIAPDGTEAYVCTRAAGGVNEGVWRTTNLTNTTPTFAKVYGPSTVGQYPVRRAAVNWTDTPNETVYIQLNGGNPTGGGRPGMAICTTGNGSTWTHYGLAVAMLGYETDSYHRQLSTATRNGITAANGFEALACPNAAGACVVNSVGRMFRTLTKGAVFSDCSLGFTGCNAASNGHPKVAQNPDNLNEVAISLQDINLLISRDNCQSFKPNQIGFPPDAVGGHPNPDSSYAVGWGNNDRLFLGFGGQPNTQGLVYTDDYGETYVGLVNTTFSCVLVSGKLEVTSTKAGFDMLDFGMTLTSAVTFRDTNISNLNNKAFTVFARTANKITLNVPGGFAQTGTVVVTRGTFGNTNGNRIGSTGSVDLSGMITVIGRHPSTPDSVVAGRAITTDNGLTWAILAGGGRVEAINSAGHVFITEGTSIYVSKNWQSGAGTMTRTPFYVPPSSISKFGHDPGLVIRAGPVNDEIWIKGPEKKLYRVRNTTAGLAGAQPQLFPMDSLSDVGVGVDFEVSDIALHPTDVGYIVVTLQNPGGNVVWRGRINGATIAWENIASNVTRWFDLSAFIFDTGDILVGGGMGLWCYPRPAGYSAVRASLWGGLAPAVNIPALAA